jgi:hypothetical protein
MKKKKTSNLQCDDHCCEMKYTNGSSCGKTKIFDGNYCQNHTCYIVECFNKKKYDHDTRTWNNKCIECIETHCVKNDCKDIKSQTYGAKYCNKHECPVGKCTSIVYYTNCKKHTCKTAKCSKAVQDNKNMCKNHGCNHDKCTMSCISNDINMCHTHHCQTCEDTVEQGTGSKCEHYCAKSVCLFGKEGREKFCEHHECRDVGCDDIKILNSKFCIFHKCKVAGCNDIRSKDNMLICRKHTNTGEGKLFLKLDANVVKDIVSDFVNGSSIYESIGKY